MPRRIDDESRMLRELLETAEELNRFGAVQPARVALVRALCAAPTSYSSRQVREIRLKTGLSAAQFAALLNVGESTVRAWESPAARRRPRGAAVRLLQLLDRRGIDALTVTHPGTQGTDVPLTVMRAAHAATTKRTRLLKR